MRAPFLCLLLLGPLALAAQDAPKVSSHKAQFPDAENLNYPYFRRFLAEEGITHELCYEYGLLYRVYYLDSTGRSHTLERYSLERPGRLASITHIHRDGQHRVIEERITEYPDDTTTIEGFYKHEFNERGDQVRRVEDNLSDTVPEQSYRYEYDYCGDWILSERRFIGEHLITTTITSWPDSECRPIKVSYYNNRYDFALAHADSLGLRREQVKTIKAERKIGRLMRINYHPNSPLIAHLVEIKKFKKEEKVIGEVFYEYDTEGRLLSARYPMNRKHPEWDGRDEYTYDERGRLIRSMEIRPDFYGAYARLDSEEVRRVNKYNLEPIMDTTTEATIYDDLLLTYSIMTHSTKWNSEREMRKTRSQVRLLRTDSTFRPSDYLYFEPQPNSEIILATFSEKEYFYPARMRGSSIVYLHQEFPVAIGKRTKPFDWEVGSTIGCDPWGYGNIERATIKELEGEQVTIEMNDGSIHTTHIKQCRSW